MNVLLSLANEAYQVWEDVQDADEAIKGLQKYNKLIVEQIDEILKVKNLKMTRDLEENLTEVLKDVTKLKQEYNQQCCVCVVIFSSTNEKKARNLAKEMERCYNVLQGQVQNFMRERQSNILDRVNSMSTRAREEALERQRRADLEEKHNELDQKKKMLELKILERQIQEMEQKDAEEQRRKDAAEAEQKAKRDAERKRKEEEKKAKKLQEFKSWTTLTEMTIARTSFGAVCADDKLFAWGDKVFSRGEYLDLKNVSAGWKPVHDKRFNGNCSATYGDGKLFCVSDKGGEYISVEDIEKPGCPWKISYEGYSRHKYYTNIETGEKVDDLYKPKDHFYSWKTLPRTKVLYGAEVTYGDGKLFVVGGRTSRFDESKGVIHEGHVSGKYLLVNDMEAGWKNLPDMSTGKAYFALIYAKGCLYAIGGEDGNNTNKKGGEFLDLSKPDAEWKKFSVPYQIAISEKISGVYADGKIYLIGGAKTSNSENLFRKMFVFYLEDPKAAWKYSISMTKGKCGMRLVHGNDKLFLLGGVWRDWDKKSDYGGFGKLEETPSVEYLRIKW